MKNTFQALLIAVFAVFSFGAYAAEVREPDNIEAIVKTILPEGAFSEGEPAFGDLNHDGLPDLAVLVSTGSAEAGPGPELKIFVFLANRNGGYTHFVSSEDVFPHERVHATLTIEKGILQLNREGSGGCCSRWSEDFKFKMVNGDLVLIGTEVQSNSLGEKIDDNGASVNFLAKKVIFWRKIGKKRKEVVVALPPFELLKLRDFNYSDYDTHLPAQARGYLDEHFLLKQ